jgi:hypothetical protein
LGDGSVKFRPDLRLQRIADVSGGIQPAAAPITEATLVTENMPYEESDIPPHLEIVTEAGEVITVIEVLSPTNKEGEFNGYLSKRYRFLTAGINLVEIDLLREGQRVSLGTEVAAPYMCLVSRAYEYPKIRVWGVSWANPFPVLPVPLRPDEPDVQIQLATALEQAYAVEFEGFVNYAADPPGFLTDGWRQEIDDLLRARGLR